MHIVKATAEVDRPRSVVGAIDALKDIERYGRISHASEGRITEDSYVDFIRRFAIEQGHESMLEHRGMSIIFVCDRVTSHQLVRHRIAAWTQASGRYIKRDNVGFVEPYWGDMAPKSIEDDPAKGLILKEKWKKACQQAEYDYVYAMSMGVTADEARKFLPPSEATRLVGTMNLRQWRHVFKERVNRFVSREMLDVMRQALTRAKELFPVVFEDIPDYDPLN